MPVDAFIVEENVSDEKPFVRVEVRPTMPLHFDTDRTDCAGQSPVRVAHGDVGGEQIVPDSARRVAQHCSDAFE